MKRLVFLAFGLGLVGACGSEADIMQARSETPQTVEAPLTTPTVRLVSPPEWQAGGVVTVLGNDFVAPARGHTELRLVGTFIDAAGKGQAVDMTMPLTYKNAGRAEFVFEPALPPAGFGYDLGRFEGAVSAVNVDDDDSSANSQELAVSVDVGASLLIWSMKPDSNGCAATARVSSTLDGETLIVDLEAIGLTQATPYTPLTLRATYANLQGEPKAVEARLSAGRRSTLELPLGNLPEQQLQGSVSINLAAVDGLENEITRFSTVTVGREYSIVYDGNVRVAELYAPVQVSSCLPGGAYGSSVSYSAGTNETRSRQIGFSVNVGLSLWIANVGFGMNVSESVSSTESESLSLTGHIWAGQFGVFYRQTQRLERLGQIVQRDACGAEQVIGEARVTDWNWAPDLAITTNGTCPPAPPSNLPPAQVF